MGTSEATVRNTSVEGQGTGAVVKNYPATTSNTTVSPQDTSAETSVVCSSPGFNFNQQVVYDGYLDKSGQGILADTLIIVSNTNKVGKNIQALIDVFDKYGKHEIQGKFYNSGQQIATIPANGFGWITLGMLVSRATQTPFGSPGGEKFTIKISTDKGGQYKCGPTIVEVKQVSYKTRQENPGKAIWNAANIATWSETALGGKLSSGVVWYPKNIWP